MGGWKQWWASVLVVSSGVGCCWVGEGRRLWTECKHGKSLAAGSVVGSKWWPARAAHDLADMAPAAHTVGMRGGLGVGRGGPCAIAILVALPLWEPAAAPPTCCIVCSAMPLALRAVPC